MKAFMAALNKIWWIKFALRVFGRFGSDNGGMYAGGMSFFMVLSFIPMLLVGIAALGYYFHLAYDLGIIHTHTDPVTAVTNFITTQVVPGKSAGAEVQNIVQQSNIAQTIKTVTAKRGISGIVGILGLVWSALQIFINASVAMNAAWETREKRNWLKLHLLALGLLIASGVLVALSLAATTLGTTISKHILFPGMAVLTTIGTEIGAVVVATLMYTIIYKMLPAASVTWKSAFWGALVAAVSWEIAKKGLAVVVLRSNPSLYGSLADLFVFVLWIYYSMMIMLIGAEVSVVYCETFEGHRGKPARQSHALDAAGVPGRSKRTLNSMPEHSSHRKPNPAIRPGGRS